jgi:hypothetical protein
MPKDILKFLIKNWLFVPNHTSKFVEIINMNISMRLFKYKAPHELDTIISNFLPSYSGETCLLIL